MNCKGRNSSLDAGKREFMDEPMLANRIIPRFFILKTFKALEVWKYNRNENANTFFPLHSLIANIFSICLRWLFVFLLNHLKISDRYFEV